MKDKKMLSAKYLNTLDKYWRAANYLTVAQLYLEKNPLLKTKLELDHVKKRLLGHWGTCPGQNFVYAHCNRVITKYDLNMIYLSGPGHGGNFFVSNSYLEGTYSEYYPQCSLDEKGMTQLCKQFSYAGGIPSHVAPETPGSINEGGELGYCLAHGFGAVLDNPDLIATVVVGDGEAETGPLATSWHSNKFINPKTDGAVLPILHLNGYKIANPTVLARISHEQLESLFKGYGYKPYFVEGSDPKTMHKLMAKAMDKCIETIKTIQYNARNANPQQNIVWPMIVLRTPKGWTAPSIVDGKMLVDSFRAHQVPISMTKDEHLSMLENWLLSYKPHELFDDNYKLKPEIAAILPKGDHRLSANPNANGGLLLKDLKTPSLKEVAFPVEKPGVAKTQDMLELGGYIKKLYELNRYNNNYRIFSPDEAKSNRLYKVFETELRDFNTTILPTDEDLSVNGRIMDSYLSEHMCEGWLEGYLLTGRHGLFHSYEAFLRVVDSMVSQHGKWLKTCNELKWRKSISSLNLILTSHTWQQDHNGYTHQDPGMFDHMLNKHPSVTRAYLPADANTLIATYDMCAKMKDTINLITASKKPSYQWLNMEQAEKHVKAGLSVWDFACLNNSKNPDVVIACCGDTPTIEAVATVSLIKKYLPKLNVKFVNVVNLMRLYPNTVHPEGLSDKEFNEIFTTDKPIVFSFHGYPGVIKQLCYDRANRNLHVRGYHEEGTITTAFDMRVKNHIDRFNMLKTVAEVVDIPAETKKQIITDMENKLIEHKKYICKYGVDMPEIENWSMYEE
mgnify:CR=1 FL=1